MIDILKEKHIINEEETEYCTSKDFKTDRFYDVCLAKTRADVITMKNHCDVLVVPDEVYTDDLKLVIIMVINGYKVLMCLNCQ